MEALDQQAKGCVLGAWLRWVAVSGRREQEPSLFIVIVWRDQAEHAAQSLSKGSRVVIVAVFWFPAVAIGVAHSH